MTRSRTAELPSADQPALLGLELPGDPDPGPPQFIDGAQCLKALGAVLGERLRLNMADAGQYVGHNRSRAQQRFVQNMVGPNFADFEASREKAAATYARLGNVAMCGECLGAEACPLRAFSQHREGEKAIVDADSFGHYASNLSQSARGNIKNGKVTSKTRENSAQALRKLK